LTFNEFADKAKSMGYAESNARMASFRREIGEIRQKMLALQAEIEPQPVADYTLEALTGSVLLSEFCGLSPVCRFFDFLGGTEGWIAQYDYVEPSRAGEQARHAPARSGCCD
jgi:hypothetical protein